jgi:hypothetical protein
MPLPPPEVIEKLFRVMRLQEATQSASFGTFDKVSSDLQKAVKTVGIAAAQSAVQAAVTTGVQAAGVASGVAVAGVSLFTIGSALGPWMAAAAIASKADGIFALHDLRDFADGSRRSIFKCSCGECAGALTYIVNRKEANVVIVATSVFLAGLPAIFDRLNSIRKRGQKGRPKEMHSRQLVASARGRCVLATAAIMVLCGDWPAHKPPDPKLVVEVVAILLADDGWARLKAKW